MFKPDFRVCGLVAGIVLLLLLLGGRAGAQNSGARQAVVLAPGAPCAFLGECSRFDEIGLHIGTAVGLRTDSSRSYWDGQGALRLSITALNLLEGGAVLAGRLGSEGGGGPALSTSPVSLFVRLRLLPVRLGRLFWAPLRLAVAYQHDLVAGPFGASEPPGFSRGTLRLVAGQSLGRVELDGHIGFVLAQRDGPRPRPLAFDLGAAASIWLLRSRDGAPAPELRLTAEALARFSLNQTIPSEQNLLAGVLGRTASGYGGGVAFGAQVLDRQAGFLAVARLQVSWGKQHQNPWAERKAVEPKTTPAFIWKLLGAIDPVVGADGCVFTDPTPERPATQWFCIGTPAADDPTQIVLKDAKRVAVGTHLWELGGTLRLDDGAKLTEIPLTARFRKAVWDEIDRRKRLLEEDRASYYRQVCGGRFNVLDLKKPDDAQAMLGNDGGAGYAAAFADSLYQRTVCDPKLTDEDRAMMTLNALSMIRARGLVRARPMPGARLGEAGADAAPANKVGSGVPADSVAEHTAPAISRVGFRGSAPASSFIRTESLSGGTSSRLVNTLEEEMRESGWIRNPIKVVEHNGQRYVIDGHHRLEAARRARIEVQYEVIGPEEMARFKYETIDDVIHAASAAGPNRLRR